MMLLLTLYPMFTSIVSLASRCALLLFSLSFNLLNFLHFQKGSYPGNPIAKQLTRKGQWGPKSKKIISGWQFSCDRESVQFTEASSNFALTGESVGRQIWHQDEESRRLPASSTDCDFSAMENPNSSDKLFRAQMIRRWRGSFPDETTRPSTAREAARKGLQFYQMLQCEDGHWAGDYG